MENIEQVKVEKNEKNFNHRLQMSSSEKILNTPQQQVLIQSKDDETIIGPNPENQECQFQPITSPKTQIYSQPIIYNPMRPNLVVINQPMPVPPRLLSVYPQNVICPFCFQKIKTSVEENFNWLTCICFGFMIFMIFPLFCCPFGFFYCGNCGCDCNCDCKCCYDGIHKCPNCGRLLGRYNSCTKSSY